MKFDNGEEKVLVIRKHWIVLVWNVFLVALCAILPILVLRFLPASLIHLLPTAGAGPFAAFAYFLWLLFLWLLLFAFWTMYYLNIWVVTNKRIIDVDQHGLFSRELNAARIENVQDVSIQTEGIFQTLFDFGTVIIHTASGSPDFEITNAAHPNKVRQQVLAASSIAVAHRNENRP